jgi:Uma2 family endonuclease
MNVSKPLEYKVTPMATISQTKMTIEEFLSLPEDESVRRELIRGELREYPMTSRNAKHAHAISRIAYILWKWLDQRPEITGVVVAGDARCQLFHDRETVIGIDVAVFLGEDALQAVERGGSFMGPPVLAVEVLSLSDRHEDTLEKIHLYLEAQTPQIWIVDPDLQIITIHRPNANPTFFHRDHTLTGEPELPGFQTEMSSLFAAKRINP